MSDKEIVFAKMTNEPQSAAELENATGLGIADVTAALNDLEKERRIEQVHWRLKSGTVAWRLISEGKALGFVPLPTSPR